MFVLIDFLIALVLTTVHTIFGEIYEVPYFIPLLLLGYFFACALITFIFIFIFPLFIKRKGDFGNKHSRFYRFIFEEYLTFICFFTNIKIHFEGKEKLPPKGEKIVFVSNHLSKFDPITCNSVLKGYDVSWIGKRSLFKMPLINRYLYKILFMPIDREDLKQSLTVVKQAVNYLNEDQCSIGIYPEGTRNTTDEVLLPLKPGSFKIAYLSKKPLVVLAVANTEKVKKNIIKRTHVYIRVCEVIPYEKYKDLDTQELSLYVENILKENIIELRNKKK